MSCSLLLNIFVQILFITCLRGNFVFPENELKTGDLCQFNKTINGICTEHCQQTEDDFENFGITPTLCSFSETKIIVCCPDNAHHNQTEPQVLMNRSNQNNKKLTPKHNRKSNATPSYREFNSCPYNDTITGICRQQCPDLQFPNYKLLITEKKSCPVERGPPLECCVNHLQIAYSPDNSLGKGDLCQFNETTSGICVDHCNQMEDDFKDYGVTPRFCSINVMETLFCCIDNIEDTTNPKRVINGSADGSLMQNISHRTWNAENLNALTTFKEFDACPYNETITGICRQYCPDLKFPNYKLLITEQKSCPVKRGPPLECCINHLQISYSSEIFNLSRIYEEGDFCPYNDTFIGICENQCKHHWFLEYGTFQRQFPTCNYQIDETPIYCCDEYLYSRRNVSEVVPYAIEGDGCTHQKSKWGICKSKCKKLNIFKRSGTIPTMCPHNVGDEPLYCCPTVNDHDELNKFQNESSGRIFYKKCQDYKKRQSFRFKRRIHYNFKQSGVSIAAGGWNIHYGSFPHMTAIGWTNENGYIDWKCGGTLISNNYILTAAHCTIVNQIPPDTIRIGDQYLDEIEDPYNLPQDFKIDKIIKHPEYSHFSTYNDIALIKLNQSITPTSIVNPACLWNDNDDIDDELNSIAIGYGSTEFGGRNSRELLYIKLNRIEHEECVNIYKNYKVPSRLRDGIVNTQLCAADPHGIQDTCQGDSGGPLEYLIDNVHYIYGITSFGQNCPSTVPGVYTKVSEYLDWIEAIVWPNKWAAKYTGI